MTRLKNGRRLFKPGFAALMWVLLILCVVAAASAEDGEGGAAHGNATRADEPADAGNLTGEASAGDVNGTDEVAADAEGGDGSGDAAVSGVEGEWASVQLALGVETPVDLEGGVYMVTVESLDEGRGEAAVNVSGTSLTLLAGQPASVDTDGDGEDDLEVRLDSVDGASGMAGFGFRRISAGGGGDGGESTEVTPLKFLLAIFPFIAIMVGILAFKQTGDRMAFIGLALTALLAGAYFHTPGYVILGATLLGIFKSFGISLSIAFTMLMVFIMREVGALDTISCAIKKVARTKEHQTLFVGIGFGTLVTSLGVTTPAMFPPLLVAMGFPPFAAVSIAVLGYNASTSFALLSIPVTLPAQIFGIDEMEFAYRICLYLPVLATGISLFMLYMVGGKESLKRGFFPGVLSGLVIGFVCLGWTYLRLPIMIVGVVAGAATMVALFLYIKLAERAEARAGGPGAVKGEGCGGDEEDEERSREEAERRRPLDRKLLLRHLSPWMVLISFAIIVGIPPVREWLAGLDGDAAFYIFDQPVDFNALTQPYPWILLATFLALPLLRPTKVQMGRALRMFGTRIWGPMAAFSLFFSVAEIMRWSAFDVTGGDPWSVLSWGGGGGAMVASEYFLNFNINMVVGAQLALAFGAQFVLAAAWLGLFGSIIGGSETGSNILFYGIQSKASADVGMTSTQSMTTYAGLANAGGMASAITPSKINNAVATLEVKDPTLESKVMRKHIRVAVVLTLITSLLNALFVAWSL